MSDVTLYPIRGQVAQVNGKNEYIVYVPRADKYTYGTVKIGDGLLSVDGVVSLDRSEITILEIQKNGVKINPVDKIVNITLDKNDVGLSNVDNTSDEDKLASNDVKTRIESLKTTLTDDIMDVKVDLDDYKLIVEDTFAQNNADLDARLLIINNTISQNKASVDSDIERLEHIIAGKEQALAYTNYQEVVNVFNDAVKNAYPVGQTVFIQDTMVPDLWVYSIEDTHINFAYVGDEDIIETLVSTGFVQFGYYKLAMMETKTTDVSNAVTLDTAQTITGNKYFTGTVLYKNYEVATMNDINEHIISALNTEV